MLNTFSVKKHPVFFFAAKLLAQPLIFKVFKLRQKVIISDGSVTVLTEKANVSVEVIYVVLGFVYLMKDSADRV